MPIKTRFCPSPTGKLHAGGARTALLNYLAAHHEAGIFLLRIEDTDLNRSLSPLAHSLQRDLLWLGLPWQEGPTLDQDQGPYFQSCRKAIYQQYYEQLINEHLAYPCFCTDTELAKQREICQKASRPPVYLGNCQQLSLEAKEANMKAGKPYALRFKVPTKGTIRFKDGVQGSKKIQIATIGDFIIQKHDKMPAFLFCNALDDALMHVTHVIRAQDHVSNTPRQLLILEALRLKAPQYAHISLITGSDGHPLSKREGSIGIDALRQAGYLPIAIINYLARLGHTYLSHEFMSLETLAKEFCWENFVKSPACYDPKQLYYWQKQAVMHLSVKAMQEWLALYMEAKVSDLFIETLQSTIVLPSDAKEWVARITAPTLSYSDHQAYLHAVGCEYFVLAYQKFLATNDIQECIQALQNRFQLSGKSLFQPLRIALTNTLAGPSLQALATLLGPQKILERLQAIQLFYAP